MSWTARVCIVRRSTNSPQRYSRYNDGANRLTGIRNSAGNVTAIERDSRRSLTAIVAPFGQRTVLAVDENLYLKTITRWTVQPWNSLCPRMAFLQKSLMRRVLSRTLPMISRDG